MISRQVDLESKPNPGPNSTSSPLRPSYVPFLFPINLASLGLGCMTIAPHDVSNITMTVIFVDAFFPGSPLTKEERGVADSIQHCFPGILKDQGLARKRVVGDFSGANSRRSGAWLINLGFPNSEVQTKSASVGGGMKSVKTV